MTFECHGRAAACLRITILSSMQIRKIIRIAQTFAYATTNVCAIMWLMMALSKNLRYRENTFSPQHLRPH